MEEQKKVADNAFNQAVGKVRQFAERVGNFTDSQKNYGNKVQGKIDDLARLVARLRNCKEQIRGIRQALRDCESRSTSALTEARAGADRARAEAVQAARDEERGRATDALNTAAANFDALSGALDGILASMNSIDNIDLGALQAEVDEICAEAGGTDEGKGGNNSDGSNSNNNSDGGENRNRRFRSAARAVQGAEAFDRSRSGPASQRRARAPGGAWGRGPPGHGTAARASGKDTRSGRGTFGGYRYGRKTRKSHSKTAKGSKKKTRRKRQKKRR